MLCLKHLDIFYILRVPLTLQGHSWACWLCGLVIDGWWLAAVSSLPHASSSAPNLPTSRSSWSSTEYLEVSIVNVLKYFTICIFTVNKCTVIEFPAGLNCISKVLESLSHFSDKWMTWPLICNALGRNYQANPIIHITLVLFKQATKWTIEW